MYHIQETQVPVIVGKDQDTKKMWIFVCTIIIALLHIQLMALAVHRQLDVSDVTCETGGMKMNKSFPWKVFT
jgi:hypothetical protein